MRSGESCGTREMIRDGSWAGLQKGPPFLLDLANPQLKTTFHNSQACQGNATAFGRCQRRLMPGM
jgi:hypothetical protein